MFKKRMKKMLAGTLAAVTALATALTSFSLGGISAQAANVRMPNTELEVSSVANGTYTVPVSIYTLESIEGDRNAEYSMGNNYVGQVATVVVKDGNITASFDAYTKGALMNFCYFESADNYNAYAEASAAVSNGTADSIPEEIQYYLKDADTAPNDVKFTTQKMTFNNSYTGNVDMEVDVLTFITLRLPDFRPSYIAGFKAGGMDMGQTWKFAKLGFNWNQIQTVSLDPDAGSGSGEETDPATPEPSTPDPAPEPEETEHILITRYKALKEQFEALDTSNIITTQRWYTEIGSSDHQPGWVKLNAFFEKWDASVEDESVLESLDAFKKDLQSAYKTMNDISDLVTYSSALASGYTYEVPVKFVPAAETTISFEGDDEEDLEDFTVLTPDYEGSDSMVDLYNRILIDGKATVTVSNGNNRIVMEYTDPGIYDETNTTTNKVGLKILFMQSNFYEERNLMTKEKVTDEETGATKYSYVSKADHNQLAYLVDGPWSVSLQLIKYDDSGNYSGLETSQAFMVLDYANAKVVEGSETDVDKSDLQTLYDNMKGGYDGYKQDAVTDTKGKNTSKCYIYAPSFVEELLKEGGLMKTAAAVLEDESATQQQVDDAYNAILDACEYAPRLRAYWYDLYDEIDNTYRAYLKQTDVYTPESLEALEEAIEYFDALDAFQVTSAVAVDALDGQKVAAYLPGEDIYLTEEQVEWIHGKDIDTIYNYYDNVTAVVTGFFGVTYDDLTDMQKDAYEKYWYAYSIFNDEPEDESWGSKAKNVYREKSIKLLNTALDGLVKYADTTALSALIESASLKTDTNGEGVNYTIKSRRALESAIKAAQEAVAAGKLLDADVEAQTQAINDAIAALVDRSALKEAIDAAAQIVENGSAYTEASLAIYKAELGNARVLYSSVSTVTANDIAMEISALKEAEGSLVLAAAEELDANNLADGTYSVSVNLWHASQDKESMGNAALYHSAVLTVADGAYTLRLRGHQMTQSGQTGELDALRLVPDGKEPKGDGSNYTELAIAREDNGTDYYADFVMDKTNGVSEYYYGAIKVHTVDDAGLIYYPMGEGWVENRLRISWDSLALIDLAGYPAFSATDAATGIKVEAPEGALPKDTELRVTKITDMSTLDAALSSLADKYVGYTIGLYSKSAGSAGIQALDLSSLAEETSVEPANGIEMSITLPIPGGYDESKLAAYYVNPSGYATALSGGVNNGDGTYTVVNGKIGTYAIAEKKTVGINASVIKSGTGTSTLVGSTTTGTSVSGLTATTAATGTGTKVSTGTTVAKVKTADTQAVSLYAFMALLALSLAAGALVARKKKIG